jgi:hypothetical protein
MRLCLLSIIFLIGTFSGVKASCVDPSTLVNSTVSIFRHFEEGERGAAPGILGIRGTGWFLSRQLLVSAAHVAEAMYLSSRDWKEIEVRGRKGNVAIPARIFRVAGSLPEKIAVLELRASVPGAVTLRLRMEPLVPDERLLSLAYPNGELRFASGRFADYGSKDGVAGAALLEMHDGNDRLVLDHGASGAPVLDCQGRAVAVVSTLITQTVSLPTGRVRVSTAWQTPNVVSIPIAALEDFSGFE